MHDVHCPGNETGYGNVVLFCVRDKIWEWPGDKASTSWHGSKDIAPLWSDASTVPLPPLPLPMNDIKC